ncbi:MAG: CBS and ACT domain-containing protein [Candidatus Deferrimicrobiota bacterium]
MFVVRRMQRNIVTVAPDASLYEARELMRGHNVHQLPVTGGNGKLVGILSNRDVREASLSVALLRGATEKEAEDLLRNTPVEKVMTRKVVTATVDDTLEDTVVLLHDFRVNSLPVVDGQGRVAGIISRTDVLKAFIDVLGVGEVSSRLEVVVPDRPGGLAQIMTIIKGFNVNITSVLTTGAPEEGKRAIFFRVATQNVVPLKQAIREAGFRILDPSSFHL